MKHDSTEHSEQKQQQKKTNNKYIILHAIIQILLTHNSTAF